MRCVVVTCALLSLASSVFGQDRPIRVPRDPVVSPDGKTLAFSWQNDLWLAPVAAGRAHRITTHPGADGSPQFSPDGKRIAFMSDRSGRSQIYLLEVGGGAPQQVTQDSHNKRLLGFGPDGKSLVIGQVSDRGWHRSESGRVYLLDLEGVKPRRMLFNAGVSQAALSPDGTKVLFTRGRASWWRKGYRGPSASQLWLADLSTSPAQLTRLSRDLPHFQNVSEKDPLWAPDGKGYYFVSDPDGAFDIYYRALDGGEARRVTNVAAADSSDDGVAFPSLSADGSTMVFRRLFDMHRLDVGSGAVQPIALNATGDAGAGFIERRSETNASAIAFTPDGKQMAFVSGDDVYVMDRILREPVRVTSTPDRESSLVFADGGKRLLFVSEASGEVDIWEASHGREDGIWWLADEFSLRRVTDDNAVERGLKLSPTGESIAYLKGSHLYVMGVDGSDQRRVIEAWSPPSFDWSPDGKWFVYATQDDDYNSDVWIAPLDGSREPFNLSRHPDRDGSPVWSPDGKRIAFVGRRDGDESDIYYVSLAKKVEESTSRDRKLEEALEAMKKKGKGKGRSKGKPGGKPGDGDKAKTAAAAQDEKGEKADGESGSEDDKKDKKVEVAIDFDGILDRIHRIRVADSTESGLIWSPDGKKLAFNASVDSQRAFYAVEFPDVGRPQKMAASGLSNAQWLADSKEIVGLASASRPSSGGAPSRRRFFRSSGGVPAAMDARGKTERFTFDVRTTRDWSSMRGIAFDQGWRAMRDRFYDANLNGRDWQAVRAKYRPVAQQCLGRREFSDVMNMMLGELNASHMGHSGGSEPLPRFERQDTWTPTTYHLGMRFDPAHTGAGLLVESVIPGSPAARARSLVEPGETLKAIDGVAVGADVDVDAILTMDRVRDLELTVVNKAGEERSVKLRPVASVAGLLYDEWVENTRKRVDELSAGHLGYLHIRGMNMTSFRQMEEDLYHAGHGKDGLIIDVRFNGGGSTTDHVLTALTQPVHAVTISRGSGEGYPQDRKVYASWTKPIVLMCNEHSFSNAEILSHAVKQIGRGPVVGMRTAGGVISTGSARLMDGSSVRMPGRGWYLVSTGEDMELNGCEPDIALWNPPGGPDRPLEAAVEALANNVAQHQAVETAVPIPASVKRQKENGSGGGR